MTFPSFYDPSKVGSLYLTRKQMVIEAGRKAGVEPANRSKIRRELIQVDNQIDFIFGQLAGDLGAGTLTVPGALDDTRRLIEFIYRNINKFTGYTLTLDTHYVFHIFFGDWWADENGNHPDPFTIITLDDVLKGKWKPLLQPAWSIEYLTKLEQESKKQLMIWPAHTMDGDIGNIVPPALMEAVLFASAARKVQYSVLRKGQIAHTEFYSPAEPEVKVPNHPAGGLNTAIFDRLAKNDEIWVAGQAKSHCVIAFIRSLIHYFTKVTNQPEVIKKVRFIMDCTSSVYHPAVDFDGITNAELKTFERDYGMVFVSSTDPIVD